MQAIIYDDQWIYFDNISQHEENIISSAFSVAKPGVYIDPNQLSMWDGIIRKYNRQRRRLARPYLRMLREVCTTNNLPLEIVDNREPWQYKVLSPIEIDASFLPGITLEQYQLDALRRAIMSECGILKLPTGSGKSEIIAGLCKAISCPTLIVANQRIVLDQLKARLELRDISPEIGLFYAGKKPNGESIVVGSIQSLSPPPKLNPPVKTDDESIEEYQKRYSSWEKRLKGQETRKSNLKTLLEYVRRAGMIIIDECDLAGSAAYAHLFRHYFRGRRRYGLSGTPFDDSKPVEKLVIQEHLGSIIYTEGIDRVLERGRINKCEYNMLSILGDFKESSAYDIAYSDWITNNVKLHELIFNLFKSKPKEEGTLILVDKRALGFALEKIFNERGVTAKFIYGDSSKKQRDSAISGFENRDYNILIGSKILNRGLDLKGGCENLFIATGGKLSSGLIQQIGRALRLTKSGFSRIYDLYFRCNTHLYNHSKQRLKTVIDQKIPCKVIFPGGTISGEELIRLRFRVNNKLLTKSTK